MTVIVVRNIYPAAHFLDIPVYALHPALELDISRGVFVSDKSSDIVSLGKTAHLVLLIGVCVADVDAAHRSPCWEVTHRWLDGFRELCGKAN